MRLGNPEDPKLIKKVSIAGEKKPEKRKTIFLGLVINLQQTSWSTHSLFSPEVHIFLLVLFLM